MKSILRFIMISLVLPFVSCAQTNSAKRDQVELLPLVAYNAYPAFSYHYSGRVSTDILTAKGVSLGNNCQFRKFIARCSSVCIGVGYYRYSFNSLHNYNNDFGHGSARPIAYPSPLFLIFTTDRYTYDCVSLLAGYEQTVYASDKLHVVSGVLAANYITFSQRYHITYDNPDNAINHGYTTHNNKDFGTSVYLEIGMLKKVHTIQIGPTIYLPLYERWKKDIMFSENGNESREKWLSGLGMGLSIRKFL